MKHLGIFVASSVVSFVTVYFVLLWVMRRNK